MCASARRVGVWGSRNVVPLILSLGTNWRLLVSFMLMPLYPRYSLNSGLVGHTAGMTSEENRQMSCPAGIRPVRRPVPVLPTLSRLQDCAAGNSEHYNIPYVAVKLSVCWTQRRVLETREHLEECMAWALVRDEWSAPRLGRFIPRDWILVPSGGSPYRAGTAPLAVKSLLSYHSVRGPVTLPTEQSFTGWDRFLVPLPATVCRRLCCIGTVCWWLGASRRCAWTKPLPTATLLQIPHGLSWNWTHLPTMKKQGD
jgi:hypothetical protein